MEISDCKKKLKKKAYAMGVHDDTVELFVTNQHERQGVPHKNKYKWVRNAEASAQ